VTRLAPEAYLAHIEAESARFLEVLSTCPPDARVPSCPDWTAADLLWHLGTVQYFWHRIVSTRPAGPDGYEEPARPASYDELLAFFSATHASFVSALAAAGPQEPAWSWSLPSDQNVAFTYRRQAHEALIHRLDAELAAGVSSAMPADLATDGVHEALDVMFGGLPPWGAFTPEPSYVEYRVTDTGVSIWAQIGTFSGTSPEGKTYADEPDQHVVPAPEVTPALVVSGTAADLDAWLWHRVGDERVLIEGDDRVRAVVSAVLGQSID
jgi:uncharacterized protein (TIGR03083 family)